MSWQKLLRLQGALKTPIGLPLFKMQVWKSSWLITKITFNNRVFDLHTPSLDKDVSAYAIDFDPLLIWLSLKKLAYKATMPNRVICCRQIDKLAKKSSMFSVNRINRSTFDFPRRNAACSLESNTLIIGSMQFCSPLNVLKFIIQFYAMKKSWTSLFYAIKSINLLKNVWAKKCMVYQTSRLNSDSN